MLDVTISLKEEDLLSAISSFEPKKIVDFIKKIDENAEDWDVTLSLYKHFKSLEKQYQEETRQIELEENEIHNDPEFKIRNKNKKHK